MKLVSFPAPYCHLLSQDQKSSLKEIFKRGLDNEGDAVTAVCLYGSFTANATFSDIDLGRLMEKMRADSIEYELELESNLERQNGYPADVRTLNAAPPGFSYEVISIGQLLVDKNPNH